ncbi:isoflavone reductase-like protein [Dorcoceras hygrometricum]|uniref:Isoflavone reductase-like protein n=1 Tax=Dorcoceras hygrometricum TaxID=472368 RepID=A0A2Z7AQP9_9LAMI|nr:isoflavone reductase-like protein [Dorcoceras hygrometricum]
MNNNKGLGNIRSMLSEEEDKMTLYERAVDMLAVITKMLERESERPGKSHEEDVTERFRKQGPKEFAGLDLSRTARPSRTCLENLDG